MAKDILVYTLYRKLHTRLKTVSKLGTMLKLLYYEKSRLQKYYLNNYHYYAHTLKKHFSVKKDQKELKNLKQLTS